jgi:hypothetical protein
MTETTRLIDLMTEVPEEPKTLVVPTGTVAVAAANLLLADATKFAVSNPKGERYIFRIAKPKDFDGGYFVNVKAPGVAKFDFAYIGLMTEDGAFRTTKASKLPESDTRVKVLGWALDVIFGRKVAPAGYVIEPVITKPWRGRRAA